MDSKKKRDAAAGLRRQLASRIASEAGKVVEANVLDERRRCAGLMAVGDQAARMGVSFDVDAAIRSRISLAAARKKVMYAAADGDAEETSAFHLGKGDAAKAEDKSAMWRKAYQNNRPKAAKLPQF